VARSLLEPALADLEAGDRERVLSGPAADARVVLDPSLDTAGPAATDAAFTIMHALTWVTVRLAEHAPLALFVDDAHWADEQSLRFLVHLLGRLGDQPVAVVVAARAGEAGEGGMLAQLGGDPLVEVVALHPLGADAVASLVRRRLPRAHDATCLRCFELTGGNPLQVRELVRAIESHDGRAGEQALAAAEGQASLALGRSVLRRLGALSSEAQALAGAVAVFEDDAPLGLAARLAELAPDSALSAVDELERASLLRAGDPLGFDHPLVRAAVYERLPFGVRARTHGRAAQLLGDAGAMPEAVSSHLVHAMPMGDDVVVGILRAAGRRAMAKGAPASAVGYLERALREPPAEEQRGAVLTELGRAEVAAGRPEAPFHLEAALELTSASRERATLLLEFGRALHHRGGLEEASACFQRGLDELDDPEDELAVDLEGAYLTSAMHLPERVADAHRRGASILAGEALGTRAQRGLASKALMMALLEGRPRDEVLPIAQRLFGDGRLVEEVGVDAQALTYVIGILSWCDAYGLAEEALTLTFDAARRQGSMLTFAMASQLRARQRLWTGPIADASADAGAAVEAWRGGLHVYLLPSGCYLACALLDQDEPDEAERVLALMASQPGASGFFVAWRHAAEGRLAAHRGEDGAALGAFLAAGRRLAGSLMVNPTVLPWRSEAAQAALRLGQRDLARELIDEESELALRFGAPRAIGIARRATGLIARGAQAVEHLRAACATLAACGAHVEHARALTDLGGAVRRAGRPVEARATLRDAIATAQAAGAVAVARHARAELRVAGGRPPTRGETPVGGLTPSEQRVAALAAEGQTNREVADALFITVKSVEWHLGNVYRKLGVRGRRDLAPALGSPRADPGGEDQGSP
jgi:DNA-binding CsgD family transcriptional regulator